MRAILVSLSLSNTISNRLLQGKKKLNDEYLFFPQKCDNSDRKELKK